MTREELCEENVASERFERIRRATVFCPVFSSPLTKNGPVRTPAHSFALRSRGSAVAATPEVAILEAVRVVVAGPTGIQPGMRLSLIRRARRRKCRLRLRVGHARVRHGVIWQRVILALNEARDQILRVRHAGAERDNGQAGKKKCGSGLHDRLLRFYAIRSCRVASVLGTTVFGSRHRWQRDGMPRPNALWGKC